MSLALTESGHEPLAELNTTPLIDVLLVLLVMFIITIPVASHSVNIDLPEPCAGNCLENLTPDPVKNKLVIDSADQLLWNGMPISRDQLQRLLAATARMNIEPELQFEPEPTASYAVSARTLHQIEASGVTRFGFVGNEKYRNYEAKP